MAPVKIVRGRALGRMDWGPREGRRHFRAKIGGKAPHVPLPFVRAGEGAGCMAASVR